MRILTALLLAATPATASDRHAEFFGTWGTPKHCAKAPILDGGTQKAAPFEIGAEWLKHGEIYCALNWGPIANKNGGRFTNASAKCGEDSVRGYTLGLILKDDTLHITWDFFLKNGPLKRCTTPQT